MDIKGYIAHIVTILQNGEKQNKRSIEKIAAQYNITNPTYLKELTELAIVLVCRNIALQENTSLKAKYNSIVEVYRNQMNLSLRTSQSVLFQQYSTPAPISFLASSFVRNREKEKDDIRYFEPSAGNGLLTIALPLEYTEVNELDDIRYENLCRQAYSNVTKLDATKPFAIQKEYIGIVSNPPFGMLPEPIMYEEFPIKTLDHLMALRALDTMADNGRASIIIGGHTSWDSKGRIQAGKNRIFLSYLYKYYNVRDIININGDLYSRQGTSFDVRLILIDGRKSKAEGYAPLCNKETDITVYSFDELYDRVSFYIPSREDQLSAKIKLLKLKAKANKNKLKLYKIK